MKTKKAKLLPDWLTFEAQNELDAAIQDLDLAPGDVLALPGLTEHVQALIAMGHGRVVALAGAPARDAMQLTALGVASSRWGTLRIMRTRSAAGGAQ